MIYYYLMNKRYIDKEIITCYFQRDMLYEAQYNHASIFDNHKTCFVSKRSVTLDEHRNLSGSDKRYSFRLENSFSDVVHIFESAVDLMSFQTM